MKNYTCAIIDDEPLAGKLIENYVSRIDFIQHKATFTDSLEALTWLKENSVDFIFLDIQMPDMDGMELARLLPPNIKIIFTTAFNEYALDSYEVSAIDFLLKPIRFDKLFRACEKVRERIGFQVTPQETNEVYLKVNGEILKINTDKILYVEGMKDYVRVHLEGSGTLTTHVTMNNMEQILSPTKFLRVSRSHIISLSKIRSIDRNCFIYIGDAVIKVTDQYKTGFESYLSAHMPANKKGRF